MNVEEKPDKTMLIVAINSIIFMIYTVFIVWVGKGDSTFLALACVAGIHFSMCMIAAIVGYRKGFLLSAALLFLIGFSTCTYGFFGH